MLDRYTFRQALVVAGMTFCCMSDGFIFGQMSGMINALSSKDSPISLTDDDISWIASTINITCVCGYMVVGVLCKNIGRKKSVTILSIPILLVWIVLYYTQNKSVILFTRVIVGISFGGIVIMTYMNIGEYVSPDKRHFCVNLMSSVGSLSGSALGHILSLMMNWRNVALVGLIPTGLSCILPLFWVESPSWYALQGKFDKCEEAFRLLHKPCKSTDTEVQYLVEYERKKHVEFLSQQNSKRHNLQEILYALRKLYFWKIHFVCTLAVAYKTTCGRVLIATLALNILQETTEQTNILLFTLILDGLGIFAAAMACILVTKFKLRPLLFTSGTLSVVLLTLFSVSLYFVPNRGWFPWIKVMLLAFYCVTVNAGPYPALEIITGEVHPLEVKEFSMFLTGTLAAVMQFVYIKSAGAIIKTIGYTGLFLLNSGIMTTCLLLLYFVLPETKGKTLQEIDVYFKIGKYEVPETSIKSEQTRIFLSA